MNERRWFWGTMLLAVVIGLSIGFLGCGGGGHKGPRPEPPPPLLSVTTTPAPARRLACASYVCGATAEDFAAMEAAGIGLVIDYDQTDLCRRAANYHGKLGLPFYYGGGGTFEQVEQITRDQARNADGCREKIALVYPWDEPELNGRDKATVEAGIASAGRAFPTVPRLVAFGNKSRLTAYAGLTWRGAEMYTKTYRDPARMRERVNAADVVAIPRAFDNGGKYWGDWSDAQTAAFVRSAYAELAAGPTPLVLWYTFADNVCSKKPDKGWRDLPQTRAAITAVCR